MNYGRVSTGVVFRKEKSINRNLFLEIEGTTTKNVQVQENCQVKIVSESEYCWVDKKSIAQKKVFSFEKFFPE